MQLLELQLVSLGLLLGVPMNVLGHLFQLRPVMMILDEVLQALLNGLFGVGELSHFHLNWLQKAAIIHWSDFPVHI